MARPDFEPDVKTDNGGATAGVIWSASRALADEMAHRSALQSRPQTVLELGSGTGYLAMRLAAAEAGTRVIATDVAGQLRALKKNVNRNGLGHAVRCVPWDWNDWEPPDGIDWQSITSCVAADVVYYDEFGNAHEALARALATVLERCRPCIEVLLMLRVRVNTSSSRDSSVMEPSDSYTSRSSVWQFIEEALPLAGLAAALLPLGGCHECGHSLCGLRLYRISRSEAAMEAASARASDRSVLPLPTLPPAGLGGLGEEDESSLLSLTAWSRWCDYDYV